MGDRSSLLPGDSSLQKSKFCKHCLKTTGPGEPKGLLLWGSDLALLNPLIPFQGDLGHNVVTQKIAQVFQIICCSARRSGAGVAVKHTKFFANSVSLCACVAGCVWMRDE